MVIRYFRSNQSVLLLTTPIVAAVCWAIHFFGGADAFQYSGYLLEKLSDAIYFSPFVSRILAMVFISLQALLINSIIQKTEVFSKLSHVPLLFTILIGSLLSYHGGMDPALIANFFMLLAISELLRVYHQNSVIGITFNVGFWIGMAALLEPLLIITLPVALAGVLILRSADWRELLLMVIGGFLPTGFLVAICFAADTSFQLPGHYFHPDTANIPYFHDGFLNALLIFGSLLFIMALFFYLRSLKGIIMRTRKMRLVLLYFLLALVILSGYLLLTNSGYLGTQILLLPLVFILSFLYIHAHRTFLLDTWFYGLVILWGFFVYNLYFL